jgi:hypothetical protein
MSSKEIEEDVEVTLSALRTLFLLVVTSSTIRLFLSDVLFVTREMIADTAIKVAKASMTVENRATEVDELIRPPADSFGLGLIETLDSEAIQNKGKEVASDVKEGLRFGVDESTKILPESSQRIQEALLARIKTVRVYGIRSTYRIEIIRLQVVVQTQSDPAFKAALSQILDVLHKYAEASAKFAVATRDAALSVAGEMVADIFPASVKVDPDLEYAMRTLRTFLNRFGEGVDPYVWIQFHHNLK